MDEWVSHNKLYIIIGLTFTVMIIISLLSWCVMYIWKYVFTVTNIINDVEMAEFDHIHQPAPAVVQAANLGRMYTVHYGCGHAVQAVEV